MLDCATEAISDQFNASFEFIHDALSNHGRVLVHCLQGMSRSATIASAYVMKALHVSADEAVSILQAKRGIVRPNYGFMIQLEFYGKQMEKQKEEEISAQKKEALETGNEFETVRRASI
eukprot:TRINITY_DN4073_c0_g1_i5.p1 TRINITY_DN4073_c0_g1~~TRINITY_DN4073_c0_g1_i5.p1  ORF type:complete len:119 (+),score=44.23 TRINITY_DN4073_c0_g1_i5:227-583(+)